MIQGNRQSCTPVCILMMIIMIMMMIGNIDCVTIKTVASRDELKYKFVRVYSSTNSPGLVQYKLRPQLVCRVFVCLLGSATCSTLYYYVPICKVCSTTGLVSGNPSVQTESATRLSSSYPPTDLAWVVLLTLVSRFHTFLPTSSHSSTTWIYEQALRTRTRIHCRF